MKQQERKTYSGSCSCATGSEDLRSLSDFKISDTVSASQETPSGSGKGWHQAEKSTESKGALSSEVEGASEDAGEDERVLLLLASVLVIAGDVER